MRNLTILLFTVFLFFSCSDNSTSNQEVSETIAEVEVNNSSETIEENMTKEMKIPYCDEELLKLESGDEIIPESEDPNIKILHDQNGDKSACTISGEIKLLRYLYLSGIATD